MSHTALQNVPYITWKGSGVHRNPVGVTATHIRPLTNNDPGNVFPTGFGLPRPMKHYRKGTVIPFLTDVVLQSPSQSPSPAVDPAVAYNLHRNVKSSVGSSLGGGSGGMGLLTQMMDMPGMCVIKNNEVLSANTIDADCVTCRGVGMVSSWMPINNLTEKPQENVTNPLLCCNQQRKARQRVLPASTNVSKRYFQTTYMQLYNRCQTFQQRQFNFLTAPSPEAERLLRLFQTYPFVTAKLLEMSKPGDPLSIANFYVAQCNPATMIDRTLESAVLLALARSLLDEQVVDMAVYTQLTQLAPLNVDSFLALIQTNCSDEEYNRVVDFIHHTASLSSNTNANANANAPCAATSNGNANGTGISSCSRVYYKPNNPQFAQQGGVSSSTRLLKLNVDTISTAAARNKKNFFNKPTQAACQPAVYTGNPFFCKGQRQNKRMCRTNKSNGAEYHTYNSVNSFSAGNTIGSIQSRGAGFADKSQMTNLHYFDNLHFQHKQ